MWDFLKFKYSILQILLIEKMRQSLLDASLSLFDSTTGGHQANLK